MRSFLHKLTHQYSLAAGIMACSVCLSARGAPTEAELNKLPTVTGHSEPETIVSLGDTLTLEVETIERELKFEWVKDGLVICEENPCTFRIAGWGLGKHFVAAILSNDFGRQLLFFTIKVEKPRFGQGPERKIPALEPVSMDIEPLIKSDEIIQAVRGIGFVHHGESTKLIDVIARPIAWSELVQAREYSVLRIGNPTRHELFLMPGARAQLKTEEGRRIVLLEEGAIRWRNVSSLPPEWTIVVGNWLQIDADSNGDTLVKLGEREDKRKEVTVTSLRGSTRVFQQMSFIDDTAGRPDVTTDIPPGASVTFVEGKWRSAYLHADYQHAFNVIKLSTPQYLSPDNMALGLLHRQNDPLFKVEIPEERKKILAKAKVEVDTISASKQPSNGKTYKKLTAIPWFTTNRALMLTDDEAIRLGKSAADQGDSFFTLEALLPRYAELKKDFDGIMILARSYKKSFHYRRAEALYREAIKLRKEDPVAHFELGEILLAKRQYAQALTHFQKARRREYPNQQLAYYYEGLTELFTDQIYYARNSLYGARALPDDQWLYETTEDYLRYIDDQTIFYFKLFAAGLYDSNVFRVPADRQSVTGIDTLSASGYSTNADIRLKFFNAKYGAIHARLFLSDLSYFEPQLTPIRHQRVEASLPLSAFLKFWEDLPFIHLKYTPFIGNHTLGEGRAADTFGHEAEMQLDLWALNPVIRYRSERQVDPLPEKDDILDIDTKQIVLVSDRSTRIRDVRFGLTLPVDPELRFYFLSGIRTSAHTNLNTAYDDYEATITNLSYWQRYSPKLTGAADLLFTARDYYRSEEKRNDTLISFDLRFDYHFTFSIKWGVFANYEMQRSDDEDYGFTRYQAGSGISLLL